MYGASSIAVPDSLTSSVPDTLASSVPETLASSVPDTLASSVPDTLASSVADGSCRRRLVSRLLPNERGYELPWIRLLCSMGQHPTTVRIDYRVTRSHTKCVDILPVFSSQCSDQMSSEQAVDHSYSLRNNASSTTEEKGHTVAPTLRYVRYDGHTRVPDTLVCLVRPPKIPHAPAYRSYRIYPRNFTATDIRWRLPCFLTAVPGTSTWCIIK